MVGWASGWFAELSFAVRRAIKEFVATSGVNLLVDTQAVILASTWRSLEPAQSMGDQHAEQERRVGS